MIVAKSMWMETTELHIYLEIGKICHQLVPSALGPYVTIIEI